MKIEDILAKVQNGQALSADERAALNKHLDAQAGSAPAANVDLSQLSPEARAIVESAQAEAAAARQEAQTAQATANTERDSRLGREFSERAVALGQPAAFGATLRSASEKLTAEEYQTLEQSLNATGAQQQLLGESGSGKDNRDSGNVQADYRARVEAHIKANAGTSRANAGRAVLAADPAFAKRYRGQ